MGILRSKYGLGDGVIPLDYVEGVTDEELRHFARLFAEAWDRVPSKACLLMEEYWESKAIPHDDCTRPAEPQERHPNVLLHLADGMPVVMYEGLAIHFHAKSIQEMGDKFAIISIMHELAHVCFYASGEPTHWSTKRSELITRTIELLVDERLRNWGVDQSDLLMWVLEYEARTGKMAR